MRRHLCRSKSHACHATAAAASAAAREHQSVHQTPCVLPVPRLPRKSSGRAEVRTLTCVTSSCVTSSCVTSTCVKVDSTTNLPKFLMWEPSQATIGHRHVLGGSSVRPVWWKGYHPWVRPKMGTQRYQADNWANALVRQTSSGAIKGGSAVMENLTRRYVGRANPPHWP